MIEEEKVIVVDLDGTLCSIRREGELYDVDPYYPVVEKLRAYKENGFYIIIDTARNMRTYHGNIGKINANTLKSILAWLDRHQIPYDEIHVGKPWAGRRGFYIDDRSIRPSEFLNSTYEEIMKLIESEKESVYSYCNGR